MPRALGVVVGFIAWTVVATMLDLALGHGWPGYAATEKALAFTRGMPFTPGMLIAREVEGFVATLAAGFAAGFVSRTAVPWLAGVLLAFFIPVHYSLWDRFPVWYHLVFLVSLPLLTYAGGMLCRRKA